MSDLYSILTVDAPIHLEQVTLKFMLWEGALKDAEMAFVRRMKGAEWSEFLHFEQMILGRERLVVTFPAHNLTNGMESAFAKMKGLRAGGLSTNGG